MRALAALLLLLLPGHCLAEVAHHGDFTIHYTTFASTLIPAEVAAAHGIVRAENQVVLNISVLRDNAPSPAVIEGAVVNLLNQRFELVFEEVNEAEAIYYLASHTAIEQDILRFSIIVTPPGAEPFPISFLRRYD